MTTHPPTPAPSAYPGVPDDALSAVLAGQWVKSSYSNGNGGCLSFTASPDGQFVGVQDDKLPVSERVRRTQVFDRNELAAFVKAAKDGEFDHLI